MPPRERQMHDTEFGEQAETRVAAVMQLIQRSENPVIIKRELILTLSAQLLTNKNRPDAEGARYSLPASLNKGALASAMHLINFLDLSPEEVSMLIQKLEPHGDNDNKAVQASRSRK